jgi:hypothetical protein
MAYDPEILRGVELLSNENVFAYKLKQSKSCVNNDVRKVISSVGINL